MTKEIILDKGGDNEITVYTFKVEEVKGNQLITVAIPQSSANWGLGPKDTLIVDLLRITTKFNIDGKINASDREKLHNIFEGGGVFTMEYAGTEYSVACEKLMITESPSDAGRGSTDLPGHFTVKFTVVKGVNYGSS